MLELRHTLAGPVPVIRYSMASFIIGVVYTCSHCAARVTVVGRRSTASGSAGLTTVESCRSTGHAGYRVVRQPAAISR